MNEKMNLNNPQFSAVSQDELLMVSGGSIWGWIKKAATWVKDHIWVDVGSRSGGIKGKF